VIDEAEGSKVKRMMYAETQREKMEILEAIRASEWNVEMNPLVVAVQDGVRVEHDLSKGCVRCCRCACDCEALLSRRA
jgi:trafficking protein particle complex subunit 8